jgi:signal transduction histidine kinase
MKHPFSSQQIIINPTSKQKNCFVIQANEQFASMLGLPLSNILHQSFPALISYLQPKFFDFDKMLNSVMDKQEHITCELDFMSTSKVYLLTLYPTEKNHFASIFEDITSQRDLEVLRNEFINTLTHEIRTH